MSGTVSDAVAQAVIEGLTRRAAAQQGPARKVMLQRAAQLQAMQDAAAAVPQAAESPNARRTALAGLGDLVDRLGRQAQASPVPARAPLPHEAPPLKAVAAFQGTWSRLRAEQRLRQALAQVPAKAGPLNSQQVVHRALQAMHDLSPAYLDAFMAHIDTLLALEQAAGGADPVPRAASRGPGTAVQRRRSSQSTPSTP